MKTSIGMQTVLHVMQRGAVILLTTAGLSSAWAQGDAQVHAWAFDNSANPVPNSAGSSEITVGSGGTGWRDAMSGLPGATGMWDLGPSGQIRLALANPVTGPAQITVRVTHWYDGFLFDTLPVSVPNATRINSATTLARTATSSMGYWQAAESVWAVPAGSAVTEALVESPFTGVVEGIHLTLPVIPVVPLELSIQPLEDGSIQVSWPVAAGAAQLQSRAMVGDNSEWVPVAATPQTVGDRYVVTLAPDQDAAFFRLKQ